MSPIHRSRSGISYTSTLISSEQSVDGPELEVQNATRLELPKGISEPYFFEDTSEGELYAYAFTKKRKDMVVFSVDPERGTVSTIIEIPSKIYSVKRDAAAPVDWEAIKGKPVWAFQGTARFLFTYSNVKEDVKLLLTLDVDLHAGLVSPMKVIHKQHSENDDNGGVKFQVDQEQNALALRSYPSIDKEPAKFDLRIINRNRTDRWRKNFEIPPTYFLMRLRDIQFDSQGRMEYGFMRYEEVGEDKWETHFDFYRFDLESDRPMYAKLDFKIDRDQGLSISKWDSQFLPNGDLFIEGSCRVKHYTDYNGVFGALIDAQSWQLGRCFTNPFQGRNQRK